MPLRESDAYRRLRTTARQVDPALAVERGSVHWREHPSRGVAVTLTRGAARVLVFVPAEDIEPAGWEERLRARVEAVQHYLVEFARVMR
jgi:hypothetical protein